MKELTLTFGKDIKRGHDINVYDICHCTNFTVTALEDADDGVVKVEFDDMFILYAQFDNEDYEELGLDAYWVIDSGDCH